MRRWLEHLVLHRLIGNAALQIANTRLWEDAEGAADGGQEK
jgi:hypothetical protein